MSEARNDAGTDAPRRAGRGLLAVLVVSLSLNLLVLGAVAAMVVSHYGGMPAWMERMHEQRMERTQREGQRVAPLRLARPGLLLAALRRLMRRLPEERRRELRPVLRRHRAAIAAAHGEVAQARAALLRHLRQGAAQAALAQDWRALHEAEAAARERVLDMLAEFTAALTPEERRLFADIVQRRAQRRRLLR